MLLIAFLSAIFLAQAFAKSLIDNYNFTDSTQFPSFASGRGIEGFTLLKDAALDGEYISLTKNRYSGSGCIISPVPNTLTEWSILFGFTPADTFSRSSGFAFWVTRTPLQNYSDTSVFGSKTKWAGLGIFFEAEKRNAESYEMTVRAVWNNENVAFQPRSNSSAQSFAEGKGMIDINTLVRISTIKATLIVEIKKQDNPTADWQNIFTYQNIQFPKETYFGFSGCVGWDQPVASAVKISRFQVSTVSPKETTKVSSTNFGEQFKMTEGVPPSADSPPQADSVNSDAIFAAFSGKFSELESKFGGLSSKIEQMQQVFSSLSSSMVKQQSVENIAATSRNFNESALNQMSKLSEKFNAQIEAFNKRAAVFENETKNLKSIFEAKFYQEPSSPYKMYGVFIVVQAVLIVCMYFYLKRQKYEPLKKVI